MRTLDWDLIRLMQSGDPFWTNEEEDFFASIILEFEGNLSRIESNYNEIERPKIYKELDGMASEFSSEYKNSCKVQYLKSKLRNEYLEYMALVSWVENYKPKCEFGRYILEKNKEDLSRRHKHMLGVKRAIENMSKRGSVFSLQEIDLARSVKMSQVLDTNRDVIRCFSPNHNDRLASMNIKGSFFFCHGCGIHGNVLDYMMEYGDMDFRSAVKYLLELST